MESIPHYVGEGDERFTCAQAGCQECVNELLRSHRKLVVAVVRKQWLGERAAFADLVQDGNIALWRAILGFDPRGEGWPSARMPGAPSSGRYGRRWPGLSGARAGARG